MSNQPIFSQRYSLDSEYEEGLPLIDYDRWVAEFRKSNDDRSVLADRVIALAQHISKREQIGMDIYDSEYVVQIDVFLDDALYFENAMQALAALLQVCDRMNVIGLDRSLQFDRIPFPSLRQLLGEDFPED